MFFCRSSGMLIFQVFVNTLGSWMVASYWMVSASSIVYRSVTQQRIAVKISGHVEPRFIVLALDLHHQRVAFPVAARIPHPGVDSLVRRRLPVGVDQPVNLGPLEGDRDVLGGLENLKRKLQVHDPRDAREIALPQRIGRLPVGEILDLLRGGPRLIRNRAAFDDALARGIPSFAA